MMSVSCFVIAVSKFIQNGHQLKKLVDVLSRLKLHHRCCIRLSLVIECCFYKNCN